MELEKKKCDVWKTIGIIFIILFIVVTALLVYLYNVGSEIESNELECQINICGEIDAAGYYYDFYDDVCYCFDKDHNVIKQTFIGGMK